jgi:hypothetical protein
MKEVREAGALLVACFIFGRYYINYFVVLTMQTYNKQTHNVKSFPKYFKNNPIFPVLTRPSKNHFFLEQRKKKKN